MLVACHGPVAVGGVVGNEPDRPSESARTNAHVTADEVKSPFGPRLVSPDSPLYTLPINLDIHDGILDDSDDIPSLLPGQPFARHAGQERGATAEI